MNSPKPFAFGIHTTHSLIEKATSEKSFKVIASLIGIASAGLSLELTMVGLQTSTLNPVKMLIPGSDARLEKKARELRFIPKGFDDGAKVTRILPTPLLHSLATRTDAVAMYGPLGVLGDVREDEAIEALSEKYSNPEEVYETAVSKCIEQGVENRHHRR